MSMAMGPPPSRKMTRTPPVYQQVSVLLLTFSVWAKTRLSWASLFIASVSDIVFYQTCPNLFVC